MSFPITQEQLTHQLNAAIITIKNEFNETIDEAEKKLNEKLDELQKIIQNLTKINKSLTEHLSNKKNPHVVTTRQIAALPITGGTVTGNISASNVTAQTVKSTTVKGNNASINELVSKNFGGGNDAIKMRTGMDFSFGKNLHFAEGAWMGQSNLVMNDNKIWMHIGGHSRDNKRYLALYGDPVWVQGSLYVEGNVYIQSRKISNSEIRGYKVIDERNERINSSRDIKKNISPISIEYVTRKIIKKLNPKKFVFKDDPEEEEHLGFIAEEVPDILTDKDHKTVKIMDIIAALVKVVQDQQKKIEILESKIS